MKKFGLIIALVFLLVACKGDDSQLENRVFVLEQQMTSVEEFLDAQIEVNIAVATTLAYQAEVNQELLILIGGFHR
jgi:hypothetical protein